MTVLWYDIMQPLVPIYRPGGHFEISAEGLKTRLESECFQRVFGSYRNYPPRSLQSDEARALLHHLIVMRRPEFALEIGTYMAGTAEVLARALWERSSRFPFRSRDRARRGRRFRSDRRQPRA